MSRLAAVAALLLASCAVLTVDVDVYKGPLSNEQEVQVEQLAVMAIGAKPLLIALRDQLENDWKGRDDWNRKHRNSSQEWRAIEKRDYYQTRAIPRRVNHGDPNVFLQDADAIRVNEILSLYDDVLDENLRTTLGGFWRKAFSAGDHYAAARRLLDADDLADAEFWTPYQKLVEKVMNSDWFKKLPDGLKKSHGRLLDEWRQFHMPVSKDRKKRPVREIRLIGMAHDEFAATLHSPADSDAFQQLLSTSVSALSNDPSVVQVKENALSLQPFPSVLDSRTGQPDDQDHESNRYARLISDPDDARILADVTLLFGPDLGGKERRALIERTRAIAGAFIDARASISRLLIDALEFIETVDGSHPMRRMVPDSIIKGAMRVVTGSIRPFRLRDGMLEASANGIEIPVLKELLEPPSEEKLKGRDRPDRASMTVQEREYPWWTGQDLGELLTAHPAEVAHEILAIHRKLQQQFTEKRKPESVRFGVVVAISDKTLPTVEEIRTYGEEIKDFSSGGGFEGGRINEGLETLIENYLNAAVREKTSPRSAGDATPEVSAEDHLAVLLDALAGFAEKVLFIGNFGQLLAGRGADENAGDGSGSVSSGKVESKARILQAVGNSILTEANEIHHARYAATSDGTTVPPDHENTPTGLRRNPARALYQLLAERLNAELEAATRSGDAKAAARMKEVEQVLADERETVLGNVPSTASGRLLGAFEDRGPALVRAAEELGALSARMKTLATTYAASASTPKEQWEALVKATADFPNELQTRLDGFRDPLLATLGDAPIDSKKFMDELNGAIAAARTSAASRSDRFARALPAVLAVAASPEFATLLKLFASMSFETKNTAATEIIDQRIANLEFELIDVVKRDGKDAPAVIHLTDAIDTAIAERGQLISIRPPAAYLRNSYPMTSLQADPGLGDKNLLLPAAYTHFAHYHWLHNASEAAKVTADIDKQFWQNINHVEVRGSGNTNYAVAKDDVGNWYVKNYSADPKVIIEGMKSIALFAAGQATGTSLLGKVADAGADAAAAASGAAAGDSARFERFRAHYDDDAKAEFDAAKRDAVGLSVALRNDFASRSGTAFTSVPRFDSIEATAATSLAKAVNELAPKAGDHAVATARLLRAVLDYSTALRTGAERAVAALDAGDPKTQLQKQFEMLEVVRKAQLEALVSKRIARRETAAETYRRTIEVFSEGASAGR